MPKLWRLIAGGIALFFLGSVVGVFVSWCLYQRGLIFNEKEIPNPVFEYAKQGRYDDAIREALSKVHDDHRDYFEYLEVAEVYLQRAYKDEPHREAWVQQADSYLDRVVSLAPTDDVAFRWQAAAGYEQAGDLAKNGCPYYEKGSEVCDTLNSILAKDSLMVREFKFPTKDLRQDSQALQRRIRTKLEAWCNKPSP